MNNPGALVISLDFELYWGMRDHRSLNACRDRLLGVRLAIPAMLERFRRHGVHASWATVGLLMFDTRKSLLAGLPDIRPHYENMLLSPYPHVDSVGADEASDPFHYGLSLVRRIAATPGQEIASHTFSHFYCLEPGQTELQFRADLDAARAAAARIGLAPTSIVFPRDQVAPAYLPALAAAGMRAYRGTETSRMYQARSREARTPLVRAGRLLDAYLNIGGHHLSPRHGGQPESPVRNVPASRFLRPTGTGSLARKASRLRLARITESMSEAARRGELFHLWWHPHNLGVSLGENLAQLDAVLEHFGSLRRRHGFESLTMSEAALD